MKSIYLLTTGEYSDYRVVGVFSTKKKAEGFIEKLPIKERDYFRVEEGVLDPAPPKLRTFTYVQMKYSGEVVSAVHSMRLCTTTSGFYETPDKLTKFGQMNFNHAHIGVSVETVNEKRAIKVANEVRAQLIANNDPHYLEYLEWSRKRESQTLQDRRNENASA